MAVERRLGHAHADLVAPVEAEQLEASGRRVPVDQVEVAVAPPRSDDESVAVTVEAEHEIGKAEILREAQAELVLDKGQVESHRAGGKAQTERAAPLHRHVQALHRQHRGKRVAVAGGESTRGKGRPLDHEGRDRAEHPAGRGFVPVGMDHRGLVEQNDGLAHVAAADEKTGAVVHGGDAGEGLEGAEDVGGSPRRRDHVEGGKGDGLVLPGGVGAGRDDGFTELDEGCAAAPGAPSRYRPRPGAGSAGPVRSR